MEGLTKAVLDHVRDVRCALRAEDAALQSVVEEARRTLNAANARRAAISMRLMDLEAVEEVFSSASS